MLPLPMYLQMNNLLTLSKLASEENEHVDLPEINELRGRMKELFYLRKTSTVKMRRVADCRIANRIDNAIDFLKTAGLKNRILKLMWKYVDERLSERISCTWERQFAKDKF